MALLFASVIFFVKRRSSLFIKYKQGPTENTFAYCRTYTKHRGHFFEKGTEVPAYQDIGQLSVSKLPIAVQYNTLINAINRFFSKKMPECLRMCKICSIFAAQNEKYDDFIT